MEFWSHRQPEYLSEIFKYLPSLFINKPALISRIVILLNLDIQPSLNPVTMITIQGY